MGTSSSSSGPGMGVSFDPPWLDTSVETTGVVPSDVQVEIPEASPAVAGKARFGEARRNLNAYVRDGDEGSLKKALRGYVRHGLGGSARATSRMRLATAVGARTFSLLNAIEAQSQSDFKEAFTNLLSSEHSLEDVVSVIVNQVIKTGGGAEEDACRESMAEALSEMLQDKPDAELMNLPETDLWWLMELFIVKVILRQVLFDIGQVFERDGIAPEDRVDKIDEIESFVRSVVSSQMQTVRSGRPCASQKDICTIISRAIQFTFEVFGR